MGYFLKNHIKLKKMNAKDWETLESIVYESDNWNVHTVPVGFIFDGASIPRFFHRFGTPMGGKYTKSACLHDWLYRNGKFTRKICDELFLESMKAEGVSYFKRYTMFYAVRAGGYWSYHNELSDKS